MAGACPDNPAGGSAKNSRLQGLKSQQAPAIGSGFKTGPESHPETDRTLLRNPIQDENRNEISGILLKTSYFYSPQVYDFY